MEKTEEGTIAKPLLVSSGIALFLMLLGLAGLGAWVLDVTGQITPGSTLVAKMDNWTTGLQLMNAIAGIVILAGVIGSSYRYLQNRFNKSNR